MRLRPCWCEFRAAPRGSGLTPVFLVMERDELIEKHAASLGMPAIEVKWVDLGGPSALNKMALLCRCRELDRGGSHTAFLVLWDRTRDSVKVMGVAAIAWLPMYLNTSRDGFKTFGAISRPSDKIAMTAIKVSIPAIASCRCMRRRNTASRTPRI